MARAIRFLLRIEIVIILIAAGLYLPPLQMHFVAVATLIAATAVILAGVVGVISAKQKAFSGSPAPFWGGLGSVVAWNPTEGVLFLKNKKIHYVDSDAHDGGGIRILFPFLGEELALRVPLEIQTLNFQDADILTREYMPLSLQGTIYWKVVDLSKFYLLISKDVHSSDDRGEHHITASATQPKLEVAEYWLRSMAEEKTRALVSQMGTGLLIADRLAADLQGVAGGTGENLPGVPHALASGSPMRPATEGLASAIKTEFASSVGEYGLEIHRVALQEVKLPAEIYAAAVAACRSGYLPIKAKAEAIERQIKLQAEADVIGKEATGLKEISKNIPALAFQDFLAPLFRELIQRNVQRGQKRPPMLDDSFPARSR